jgi:cytochrome c peroxidase
MIKFSRLFSILSILSVVILLVVSFAIGLQAFGSQTTQITLVSLTPQEQLGKYLFFDTNLSDPPGQSCASCHGPSVGYTGANPAINATGAVYKGAVPGRFGNRKPPSAAYAGDSPILHLDGTKWVGGMFWDGRATGWVLGDPLAEQAQGPFLNPLEQNNSSEQAVINKVLASSYATLFQQVCTDPTTYYECIGRAIAAYERSAEVNSFTSKYDYWLTGKVELTDQEQLGMALFNGKANCANCHVAPLFTDFTYDNLGVPRNPLNPFYNEPTWNPQGVNWTDLGLGGFLKAGGYDPTIYEAEWGKHKVPTLRNVALAPTSDFIKAYSHNGYFKSLEEIVHFYNTRDVTGAGWPAPEVADNVNTTEMGNLKLNAGEELAIVAFLKTLSDGYPPVQVTKTATLAKDADGDGVPSPGDTLKYTAVINNTGNGAATGVTFSDTPDVNTKLVTGSVTNSQGTIIKGMFPEHNSVEVAIGTIPAGGKATVAFNVTIKYPLWERQVANQAILTGTNFSTVKSDDPGTTQLNDPTVTQIKISPPVQGSGVSSWGIMAMVVLLGGAMVWVMRRRLIRGQVH